jgi:ABC-type transport system involved in multi-copper enzyme maturation permease subunit
MTISATRIAAITRKEVRDYRRNRFVIVTMSVVPIIFIIAPMIQILTISATVTSARLDERIGISLLYMLLIPAMVPAALAAYSVVGEREQGTLEPVLITPIRSEEFLLGKALAVLLPTLGIAYAIFGVFLACTALFAHAAVVSAVFEGTHLLTQLLFTPLLAGWSIWVGIAISTRSSDVRVAQQLGTLASLPPLGIAALMSFNVLTPSLWLAFAVAAGLLLVDGLGWRAVAVMFDRERLITGRRPDRATSRPGPARASQDEPHKGDPEMSATLIVTRQPGSGIELRRGRFDITVDGTSVGALDNHETVETNLEPGHHTLRINAGRYTSRSRPFDVADGETVTFRCHGASIWPTYLASIVKPDLAISLKRA